MAFKPFGISHLGIHPDGNTERYHNKTVLFHVAAYSSIRHPQEQRRTIFFARSPLLSPSTLYENAVAELCNQAEPALHREIAMRTSSSVESDPNLV